MLNYLFGVIAASYNTAAAPPPEPPPPPPSCTPVCGAWSYTYGAWSGWSACTGGTQTRTRTVTGTRTCTASNCSTYTETSTTTETESQSCGTVWYCSSYTEYFGSNFSQYTSSFDDSRCADAPIPFKIVCSTSGYPPYPSVAGC